MVLMKKGIYIICIGIFVFFLAFSAYFFIELQADVDYYSEDYFITPGEYSIEWTLSIWFVPVFIIISGVIAIFFVLKYFLKFYIKRIGTKNTLGLVTVEELTGISLFRKFFINSIILAFFTFNLCYSLASQSVVVGFMRSVNPSEIVDFVPDIEVLFHLLWLVSIPCTLIFVLIYIIRDLGLVYSDDIKGYDIKSVNLVTTNLYQLIQGYASLGFLYNFIVLVISWTAITGMGITEIGFIMMFISPIIAIVCCFPLMILLDYQKNRFKEKAWEILKESETNKRFTLNINLESIADFKDI
ncbi:MAG: hypothetical protein ACXADY_20060 [Candidatus Hodarchaeales archaeon]|jgi:hypothetical protein